MPKETALLLIEELESRFPWLVTEEDASGADTVQELCEWYEVLKEVANA